MILSACSSSGGYNGNRSPSKVDNSAQLLANKDKVIENQKINLDKLANQLDSLKKEKSILEQQISHAEKKLQLVISNDFEDKKIQSQQEHLALLQLEFDKLKKSKDDLLKKTKESFEKRVLEMQIKSDNQQRELNLLEAKLANLTKEKLALEKTHKDTEEKSKLYQQRYNDLSKKLEELKQEKQSLVDDISAVKLEKDTLNKELESFRRIEREKQQEQNRIGNNRNAVMSSLRDKGIERRSYQIIRKNTLGDKEITDVERNFSFVSGKIVSVENSQLVDKPLKDKHRELNELVVDGKSIILYSQPEIVEYKNEYYDEYEVKDFSNNGISGVIGSLPKDRNKLNFAQMRYGYLTEDGKTTLFIQGHLTPETNEVNSPYNHFYYGLANERNKEGDELKPMPKSGIFDYEGFAFYGKDNQYKQLSVKGIADFNAKKVKLDLIDNDTTKLELAGNIKGNTFGGNYQGAIMNGAFYGTAARDLGGIFYQAEGELKDYNGVFGATTANCGRRRCSESDNKEGLGSLTITE